MKRTVTAIAILIISLSISVFSYFFVKNACNQAISGIEQVLHNAITEDAKKVNLLTVQTNQNWRDKLFLLNILIGREYTEEVNKILTKLIYFSENKDYDSVIANAEDCMAELAHIIESNEPDLSTIL